MVLAVAVPDCAWAGKNKKPIVITSFEPDPVPTQQKASPDSPGADVDQPYAFGGTRSNRKWPTGLQGIDVSHYQGDINWKTVAKDKDAGYVYIKATEGRDYIDNMYSRNFSEARKHKIPVGSYHFFRPGVSAEVQYQNFISAINIKHQDLVPLVDVETISGVNSIATFHTRLLEFCRLLTQAFKGRKPMIYTGRNFYNKYFAGYPQFREYNFMIAQYQGGEPELDGGDDYLIWQYTGKGKMTGIRGDVDRSCFRGGHTLDEIRIR